jgi:hypothetical protein
VRLPTQDMTYAEHPHTREDNTIRRWREQHTNKGQNVTTMTSLRTEATREHPVRYSIKIQKSNYIGWTSGRRP